MSETVRVSSQDSNESFLQYLESMRAELGDEMYEYQLIQLRDKLSKPGVDPVDAALVPRINTLLQEAQQSGDLAPQPSEATDATPVPTVAAEVTTPPDDDYLQQDVQPMATEGDDGDDEAKTPTPEPIIGEGSLVRITEIKSVELFHPNYDDLKESGEKPEVEVMWELIGNLFQNTNEARRKVAVKLLEEVGDYFTPGSPTDERVGDLILKQRGLLDRLANQHKAAETNKRPDVITPPVVEPLVQPPAESSAEPQATAERTAETEDPFEVVERKYAVLNEFLTANVGYTYDQLFQAVQDLVGRPAAQEDGLEVEKKWNAYLFLYALSGGDELGVSDEALKMMAAFEEFEKTNPEAAQLLRERAANQFHVNNGSGETIAVPPPEELAEVRGSLKRRTARFLLRSIRGAANKGRDGLTNMIRKRWRPEQKPQLEQAQLEQPELPDDFFDDLPRTAASGVGSAAKSEFNFDDDDEEPAVTTAPAAPENASKEIEQIRQEVVASLRRWASEIQLQNGDIDPKQEDLKNMEARLTRLFSTEASVDSVNAVRGQLRREQRAKDGLTALLLARRKNDQAATEFLSKLGI